MDQFNYRQYLAENNLGPYSKTDKVEEQNMDHDQEDVDHRSATSTHPAWMQEKIEIDLYPGEMGVDVHGDDDFSGMDIVELPIDQLVRNEPKEKMAEPSSMQNLKKLVQAIEDDEELPPVLVQKVGNRYKILDGHHRYTATKLAQRPTIRAIIVPDEDIHPVDEKGNSLDEDLNPYEDNAIETLWRDVEATLLPIIEKLKDPEEAKRYAKDIADSIRYNMDRDAEEYGQDDDEYLEEFYELLPLFYSEMNSTRGGVVNAVARNLKWEPNHPELAEILRTFAKTFEQNQ